MGVDFRREVHCVLGLPFDAVDMAGTVQRLRDAAGRRLSCLISTANVNFLVGSHADSRFRDSIVNSDLNIADGMPLVWIARLLGIPIRKRVTGANLFDALRDAPGKPLSVYFFGGPDGVGAAACRQLGLEGRGLTCVGHTAPGFCSVEEMSTEEIIQRVNASRADFLVVALGAKKGQAWIEHNRRRLKVPVISHLGAVLHFTAGTVRRAPAWMQRSGLEWLWRIKEEPALWRRYLADGLALLNLLLTRVLPHAWYLRRNGRDADPLAAASVEASEQRRQYVIRLRGAWSERNIAALRECFAEAARSGKDVTLDMGGVSYADSAFLGLVMLLHGHQRQHGRGFAMLSVRPAVRRLIKYCCAEYLYSSRDDGAELSPDAEPVVVSE
jgi:N-acetylglucosaminyldiphosphoundecaprenol N-acetyl-beta-D-mannosaminyltransferase